MKAVRFHSFGGAEALVLEEAERPVAGPGEVVVQVAGTSFNPLDAAIRAGILRDVMPVALPHTPGVDVAGTVAALGEGVTDRRIGDRVIAFLSATAPGAAAEYVAVPAARLAAAPASVPLADAAALPAVGLTARQALVEDLGLRAGQRLLVNGAGGAVGGYAIQLAKRTGAHVTATASPRSAARVKAQGADRIVDHTEAPVLDALAGERFDAVLQLVRGEAEDTAALARLVADGGALATAATPVPDGVGRGVRLARVEVRSDADHLASLVALVDAGALTIDVAERLTFADLADVHARAFTVGLNGKVVLTP